MNFAHSRTWPDLSRRLIWHVGAAVDRLGAAAEAVLDRDVRVGLTGFSRSGKTVFLAALVQALTRAGRLPLLEVAASGRLSAARLAPQPDAGVPRFDVAAHLAALAGEPPAWPEPTRGLGAVRVALRYRPGSFLGRHLLSSQTLNVDFVDYPGEWLLDLPLLEQDFAQWSRATLELADRPPRAVLAAAWRGHLATLAPRGPADETDAVRAAGHYADYLQACRAPGVGLSLLQPGRFLEPGDLAGAPLLTFCPLPDAGDPPRGSLAALMAERYEAYKREVVRRFFHDHFARLDRQIVLVDLLGAMAAGPHAVADLQAALGQALAAFRHGRNGLIARLTGGRIDRVLFAATKADHLPDPMHGELRRLLQAVIAEPDGRLRFRGVTVETMALAAVRATDTVTVPHDGGTLACVRGTPIGRDRPTVLYPGALPARPDQPCPDFSPLAFAPPRVVTGPGGGSWPHLRLDRALQFLLGDQLT